LTVAHLLFVTTIIEYLPTLFTCSEPVFVNANDSTAPAKERTDFNRKRFFVAENILSLLVFGSRAPCLPHFPLVWMG
jgi:hypothetical protein